MPIKVLFINNYNMKMARDKYLEGFSPSHHQFGTSELIETGKYEIDYLHIAPKNYNKRILKLLSLFPMWVKSYFKAKKYDVVYGASDFTVDFLAIMKKIGLFAPQIIAIFHHPPFKLRISIGEFSEIIFLSPFAYKEIRDAFPSRKSKIHFFQWGPDLSFYQKIAPTPNFLKKSKLVFISNGKTNRDHEIFVTAAEQTQNQIIIVSDKNNLPKNLQNSTFTNIFHQEKPDDVKMIKLLNECSVLVIPTPPTEKKLGPIGLTSFLDAIALGMPIITANNTVFTDIILDHKMGFVYKAGDLEDLTKMMNKFKNNHSLIAEYGKNAYEYGLSHNITKFGWQLKKIIDNP